MEIRVLCHVKNKKVDMVIMSHCSPINRVVEGTAMMTMVDAQAVGLSMEEWLSFYPDWTLA